jgi:large conductance mechanosensitive channel
MDKYIGEARAFILRGHFIEFTVAVIVAFLLTDLVFAAVDDLIAPIISMIFGETSLSSMDFDINDSVFDYGHFIEILIYVAAAAAAVMLFLIGPFKQLMSQAQTDPAVAPDTRICPECLSAIPAAARRCRHCTAQSSPSSAPSAAPPTPPASEG